MEVRLHMPVAPTTAYKKIYDQVNIVSRIDCFFVKLYVKWFTNEAVMDAPSLA